VLVPGLVSLEHRTVAGWPGRDRAAWGAQQAAHRPRQSQKLVRTAAQRIAFATRDQRRGSPAWIDECLDGR
jgi:hypothetical protein